MPEEKIPIDLSDAELEKDYELIHKTKNLKLFRFKGGTSDEMSEIYIGI